MLPRNKVYFWFSLGSLTGTVIVVIYQESLGTPQDHTVQHLKSERSHASAE